MSVALAILYSLAVIVGFGMLIVGVVAAYISASVNMSFNNPLPRAGCALLTGGGLLLALGIWGIRA